MEASRPLLIFFIIFYCVCELQTNQINVSQTVEQHSETAYSDEDNDGLYNGAILT